MNVDVYDIHLSMFSSLIYVSLFWALLCREAPWRWIFFFLTTFLTTVAVLYEFKINQASLAQLCYSESIL